MLKGLQKAYIYKYTNYTLTEQSITLTLQAHSGRNWRACCIYERNVNVLFTPSFNTFVTRWFA